jgi:hypothetical protein
MADGENDGSCRSVLDLINSRPSRPWWLVGGWSELSSNTSTVCENLVLLLPKFLVLITPFQTLAVIDASFDLNG